MSAVTVFWGHTAGLGGGGLWEDPGGTSGGLWHYCEPPNPPQTSALPNSRKRFLDWSPLSQPQYPNQ